ncbi:MAG: hypothetical protein ACFFG0_29185 [Candidatus Thorarchaeota archaeon]
MIFVAIAPYTTIFILKLQKAIFREKKRKIQYGRLELSIKIQRLYIFRRSLVASIFAFSVNALLVQAGLGFLFRMNIV